MDEEQCKSCLDEYSTYLPWFARGEPQKMYRKRNYLFLYIFYLKQETVHD